MTTTKTATLAPAESTGRVLDWQELRSQIGGMTVAAISGGRARRVTESAIDLPVSSGYSVRITLEANDTYTVARVLKRGAKTFDKGTIANVYAEDVSDVAYIASCYRNMEFGS